MKTCAGHAPRARHAARWALLVGAALVAGGCATPRIEETGKKVEDAADKVSQLSQETMKPGGLFDTWKQAGDSLKHVGESSSEVLTRVKEKDGLIDTWREAGTKLERTAEQSTAILDEMRKPQGLLETWKDVGEKILATAERINDAVASFDSTTKDFQKSLTSYQQELTRVNASIGALQNTYSQTSTDMMKNYSQSMRDQNASLVSMSETYRKSVQEMISLQTLLLDGAGLLLGVALGWFGRRYLRERKAAPHPPAQPAPAGAVAVALPPVVAASPVGSGGK